MEREQNADGTQTERERNADGTRAKSNKIRTEREQDPNGTRANQNEQRAKLGQTQAQQKLGTTHPQNENILDKNRTLTSRYHNRGDNLHRVAR